MAARGVLEEPAKGALDFGWVLLGNDAPVDPEENALGHDVRVHAALDPADVERGARDARNLRANLAEGVPARVEHREDADRRAKRIDARLWNRRVRRLPPQHRFELQAAVVRGDDAVGKPGADGEVG